MLLFCHTREGGYPEIVENTGFPFSPTVGALSTGMTILTDNVNLLMRLY